MIRKILQKLVLWLIERIFPEYAVILRRDKNIVANGYDLITPEMKVFTQGWCDDLKALMQDEGDEQQKTRPWTN